MEPSLWPTLREVLVGLGVLGLTLACVLTGMGIELHERLAVPESDRRPRNKPTPALFAEDHYQEHFRY